MVLNHLGVGFRFHQQMKTLATGLDANANVLNSYHIMSTLITLAKVLIVFLYFAVGMFFYRHYEGWNWITSLFFSIVTIATVGYGQDSPSDDYSRLFTIFYMLFGIYLIYNGLYSYGNKKLLGLKYTKSKLETQINSDRTDPQIRVAITALALLLCIIVGVIFFVMNEDLTFVSALYFAVETTTVSQFLFVCDISDICLRKRP